MVLPGLVQTSKVICPLVYSDGSNAINRLDVLLQCSLLLSSLIDAATVSSQMHVFPPPFPRIYARRPGIEVSEPIKLRFARATITRLMNISLSTILIT